MPRPKKIEPVVAPVDAAAMLYKDRSGVKLGGGPTEGQSYRDAVAAEARRVMETVPREAEPDDAT